MVQRCDSNLVIHLTYLIDLDHFEKGVLVANKAYVMEILLVVIIFEKCSFVGELAGVLPSWIQAAPFLCFCGHYLGFIFPLDFAKHRDPLDWIG
jgi:hypothetical protein